MRYAELVFLTTLVLYQAVLLVRRNRRAFPANYLVFVAGMALAWNLGIEGLRWQTLPAILLLLIDLAVLFPTFSTLRGREPAAGLLPLLGRGVRTVVAGLGFVLAVGCLLLAVAFPLPQVELTGGMSPGQRTVRFPPSGSSPGLEMTLWYPASGDKRPRPRLQSEVETWQRVREDYGLPVFWQSYQAHLPTNLIMGGRVAAPKTKYPVIYVALPRGQSSGDFGYVFEDLASRGFLVVAGGPIPAPLGAPEPFDWSLAWTEMTRPWAQPALWTEPEASRDGDGEVDLTWIGPTRAALHQLATEPGDPLYAAVDGSHEGLWSWGDLPDTRVSSLMGIGLQGAIHFGAVPPAVSEAAVGAELWVTATGQGPAGPDFRWVLSVPRLRRSDIADAAYLKPFLAFVGLKSQPDAGLHGVLRQYQAAFYRFAFWGDPGASFAQTVPQVSGLNLSGR